MPRKDEGCDHDQTARFSVSARSPEINGRLAILCLQLHPGLVCWFQI